MPILWVLLKIIGHSHTLARSLGWVHIGQSWRSGHILASRAWAMGMPCPARELPAVIFSPLLHQLACQSYCWHHLELVPNGVLPRKQWLSLFCYFQSYPSQQSMRGTSSGTHVGPSADLYQSRQGVAQCILVGSWEGSRPEITPIAIFLQQLQNLQRQQSRAVQWWCSEVISDYS